MRRVRDLNKKAAEGIDELFPMWLFHLVFTDSPFALLQAEELYCGHAVVEQVFADRADSPMLSQRRDHAQPGPRRRVLGLALPCPEPQGHHPGRHDRRGRPRGLAVAT